MSVLRIRCRLSAEPLECEWVLLEGGSESARGAGLLRDAPKHAQSLELVIAAADVFITCVNLPPKARRRAGSTLAYAVEEETLGDPEAQHVTWLGKRDGSDVLAVVDRAGLERWLAALASAYDAPCAVYCETLLLPLRPARWSLAWDGAEGFLRTGELEGAATDAGDRNAPPLAFLLVLDQAAARGAMPEEIAIYTTARDAEPDLGAWEEKLRVPLYAAGEWDWRTAAAADSARIAQDQGRVRALSRVATRLRPAAWIAGAALALHLLALAADWSWLANEQRALRGQMEARFRTAFPEAVAVVDPVLQMRRKLADMRHAANQADHADFLPMMGHVAAAAKDLPAGALRLVTYDRGKLTMQLGAADDAAVQRIAGRLRDAGLRVNVELGSSRSAERAVVLTVGGE